MARQQTSMDSAKGAADRPQMETPAAVDVLKTKWFIILLLMGIGLVILPSILRGHSLLFVALEPLGLSVIVSSMVIFGLEWRSRARRLREALSSAELIEQVKELQHVRETLINAKGHESLKAVLMLLLPMESAPKYRDELVEHILELVDSMPRLTRVGIWAPHFIARMLDQAVVSSASRLSYLDGPGEHTFQVPPTGAAVADMILEAQMDTLSQGDSYEVISHLSAWKDRQLSELQNATRRASGRDVRVKRIFNLSKNNYKEQVTADEARMILKNHLRDTKEMGPGKYEVRVFFPADEAKMSRYKDEMKRAHFGIFTHQGQKLRVEVTNENLASMKMSKKQDEIQLQSDLFDAAWVAADADLDDDVIERVVRFYSTGAATGPAGS